VPENVGAPASDIIDVFVAVNIKKFRASPRSIKIGLPPTDLKALTGEFTPPGINFLPSLNRISLFLISIKIAFQTLLALFFSQHSLTMELHKFQAFIQTLPAICLFQELLPHLWQNMLKSYLHPPV